MKRAAAVLGIGLILMFNASTVKGEDMVIADGKTVKIDYTLTVNGEVVDSSEGKEPLEYIQGTGQIIPGLEKALMGLKVGDEKKVTVAAADAYGEANPTLIQEVERTAFPPDVELSKGMVIPLQGKDGQTIPAVVADVDEKNVILDFNHPMAGKELHFQVTVVDVK